MHTVTNTMLQTKKKDNDDDHNDSVGTLTFNNRFKLSGKILPMNPSLPAVENRKKKDEVQN